VTRLIAVSTIDAQVHAYERNHPGRPWAGTLVGPEEMTGDQMVAAMDAVGVDGAVLVSPFSMYRFDPSYVLEVESKHPDRFCLVKPVDPTRELSVGGFDLVENDIAVMEITSFNNVAARDRFIALQGLPLSGGDDILVGESSQPPGVSWGFSGAAAIDPAGRVAGVLTGVHDRHDETGAHRQHTDPVAQPGLLVRLTCRRQRRC
jgi:hypothetical protein